MSNVLQALETQHTPVQRPYVALTPGHNGVSPSLSGKHSDGLSAAHKYECGLQSTCPSKEAAVTLPDRTSSFLTDLREVGYLGDIDQVIGVVLGLIHHAIDKGAAGRHTDRVHNYAASGLSQPAGHGATSLAFQGVNSEKQTLRKDFNHKVGGLSQRAGHGRDNFTLSWSKQSERRLRKDLNHTVGRLSKPEGQSNGRVSLRQSQPLTGLACDRVSLRQRQQRGGKGASKTKTRGFDSTSDPTVGYRCEEHLEDSSSWCANGGLDCRWVHGWAGLTSEGAGRCVAMQAAARALASKCGSESR